MGLFTDIFGGGEQSSQSTSTPTNMNPFTAPLQAPLTNATTNLLQNGIPQYTPNANNGLAAPIGANEQTTLNQLMTANAPGSQTNGYLSDVLGGKYLPGQANANPFLNSAVTAAQRTTMNNLNDTLSRSLPGQFLAAGQSTNPTSGSSAFDTAAGTYARNAATTMGDIASTMNSNAYTSERSNQQAAVPMQQAQVQGMVNNLQAQALPRLIQQYGLDQGLQVFQQQTNQLLQLLATAGGIAQPVIGNTQQSTATGMTTPGVIPDATNAFKAAMPGGAFPKGV